MWSKGAVVVVKHGDEAMADAMEKGLEIKKKSDPNKDAETDLMKKRNSEFWKEKIEKAEYDYGYNYIPPKWLEKVRSFFALIVYGLTMFVDKYMRIHE